MTDGPLVRAPAAADVAAHAYGYFSRLFSGVEPDIAVIVASPADWKSRQPYGLPFLNDDAGQIRPGIIVMPAGSGDFWIAMGQDLRDASPRGYRAIACGCRPSGWVRSSLTWPCTRSSPPGSRKA